MEYLFIYCLQLFDNIEALKIFCICILGIGGTFWLVGKAMYLSEPTYYKEIKTIYKQLLDKFMLGVLIIAIITSFIPTKNTLLVMGGLYLGKKAVNTVITDEKVKKIDTIINLELDKRIKELKAGEE